VFIGVAALVGLALWLRWGKRRGRSILLGPGCSGRRTSRSASPSKLLQQVALPAARRCRAGGRRANHEQHRADPAARRRARGGAPGGPAHQHRGAPDCSAGGPARAPARRARRRAIRYAWRDCPIRHHWAQQVSPSDEPCSHRTGSLGGPTCYLVTGMRMFGGRGAREQISMEGCSILRSAIRAGSARLRAQVYRP